MLGLSPSQPSTRANGGWGAQYVGYHAVEGEEGATPLASLLDDAANNVADMLPRWESHLEH